jgi:hypothetical protein
MGVDYAQSRYIPAITMTGTTPIFYRIPVTVALLRALATAQYPPAQYPDEETVVLRFIPPVPNQGRYRLDGMRPLENRWIILQCFEAFKALIVGLLFLLLNTPPHFIPHYRSNTRVLTNLTSLWMSK